VVEAVVWATRQLLETVVLVEAVAVEAQALVLVLEVRMV
jgi:hypothetical protein